MRAFLLGCLVVVSACLFAGAAPAGALTHYTTTCVVSDGYASGGVGLGVACGPTAFELDLQVTYTVPPPSSAVSTVGSCSSGSVLSAPATGYSDYLFGANLGAGSDTTAEIEDASGSNLTQLSAQGSTLVEDHVSFPVPLVSQGYSAHYFAGSDCMLLNYTVARSPVQTVSTSSYSYIDGGIRGTVMAPGFVAGVSEVTDVLAYGLTGSDYEDSSPSLVSSYGLPPVPGGSDSSVSGSVSSFGSDVTSALPGIVAVGGGLVGLGLLWWGISAVIRVIRRGSV